MALLQEQSQGERFRILLAAPTGKAAGRLKQILAEDNGASSVSVATLHRLLGYLPDAVRFRHDSSNPLPCELLIVDEASMIPLPLMARLVAALPDSARLILLGDRDQLSSVEPGAVLGDICQEEVLDSFTSETMCLLTDCSLDTSTLKSATNPLSDSVVRLERSYRFSGTGGIGRLSRLVNSGTAAASLELILQGDEELSCLPLSTGATKNDQFNSVVLAGFKSYLQVNDPLVALRKFDSFRILCAVRNGERGVEGLNRRVEALLGSAGLIEPDQRWYAGRPVMVTVNDYGLRLYNGDVGIVMADPELNGALSVFFPDESGGVRRVSPLRLPLHETAYAMTVHKSQGSEFDRVLLLLPAAESQVVTRELIYTGITRARRAVIISASPEVLVAGIERRVIRNSGLSRRLWGEQVSQN
jgi:exodeoxyribonuclease V alpha subunit